MPRITSRDNARLKQVAQLLASSRARRKADRCVLEGEHIVAAYARLHGTPETLIIAETALERPAIATLRARVPAAQTLVVAEQAWPEFAQLPAAVGVLAVVATPKPRLERAADFCLLLEDVQDPGNVGSILRSAAAAGVAQVFLSPSCAFAWSPKVLRAGQGAHFYLEIYEGVDLPAWARNFRGRTLATVAAGAGAIYAADLSGPIAVAIGNEGSGLSAALRGAASLAVTIPMPGGFEALNAAAAAAICLFECVRQRRRG
ncbi:MAG TPA: RNA methyltransferase [Casimicrobiaceae bacterium]|jgi:TrmH family RNA methyltransferase|nr:RNA methyltransferase [Casimicrobiaceae bacterium]